MDTPITLWIQMGLNFLEKKNHRRTHRVGSPHPEHQIIKTEHPRDHREMFERRAEREEPKGSEERVRLVKGELVRGRRRRENHQKLKHSPTKRDLTPHHFL